LLLLLLLTRRLFVKIKEQISQCEDERKVEDDNDVAAAAAFFCFSFFNDSECVLMMREVEGEKHN